MHKYFCGLQMFTEYGPDFELDLQAGNKVNRNTSEYIEVMLQQVEGSFIRMNYTSTHLTLLL